MQEEEDDHKRPTHGGRKSSRSRVFGEGVPRSPVDGEGSGSTDAGLELPAELAGLLDSCDTAARPGFRSALRDAFVGGTIRPATQDPADESELPDVVRAALDAWTPALPAAAGRDAVREAFLAADEARLKALVKRCCKNGFADVDSAVRRGLRKWLTREARHALDLAMERGGGSGRGRAGETDASERRGGAAAGRPAQSALGKNKRGTLRASGKPRARGVAAAGSLLSLHAVRLANQFGLMHLRDGTDADLEAADVLFRRALRDGERGGLAPKLLVRVRSNLAMLLKMQGRLDEALVLCHKCYVATRRHAGEGTAETLHAANNFASTLQALGRVTEAEALYREALTSHQRAENQGADYVDVNVLSTSTRLAELLRASGRQDEAAPLAERVFSASHRVLGFVDSTTLVATNTLAGMLRGQGDNAEAARLYKRVLAASRQQLGTKHPLTFLAMYNLADALGADGLRRAAENFARLSLEGYAGFNLEGDVRDGTQQLGTILRNLGRDMEADRLADRAGYSWFCGKLVRKKDEKIK